MFDYKILIGIDPGGNGGIAILRYGKLEHVIKMKKNNEIDYKGIRDYLINLKSLGIKILIGIEKVQPRPQDAAGGKFLRLDKLFENRARLQQMIFDLEIDMIDVPVISWVNELGLRKKDKNETDTDRKNRYKQHASYLYPSIKVVGWNADAILIAEFLRRKIAFDRNWFQKNKIQKHKKELYG